MLNLSIYNAAITSTHLVEICPKSSTYIRILLLRSKALNSLTGYCVPLHSIPQARCYVLIFRSNCIVLKMSSTNGQALHNPTYLN